MTSAFRWLAAGWLLAIAAVTLGNTWFGWVLVIAYVTLVQVSLRTGRR